MIEEITEEVEPVSSQSRSSSSTPYSVTPPRESNGSSKSRSETNSESLNTSSECLQAFKDDPETIRLVHVYYSYNHSTLFFLDSWISRSEGVDVTKCRLNQLFLQNVAFIY